MKHRTILSILLPAAVALTGLTGCTDSFTGDDARDALNNGKFVERYSTVKLPKKMRQTQLFDARVLDPASAESGLSPAKGAVTAYGTLERYEELLTSTEFVVGLYDSLLSATGTLERYQDEPGVRIKRAFKKNFVGFSMHVDEDQVPRILDMIDLDDDIEWIEPDARIKLAPAGKIKDLTAGQQLVSSLTYADAHLSSTNPGDGTGSVDVDVYILDTGLDNPDLNIVERIDFTEMGNDIDMTSTLERYSTLERFATLERYEASDVVGHGTHVAGIAAAVDDDDALVGAAPGAMLHDYKVLDDNGSGEMSGVIAALDVITARKMLDPSTPVVVNLSFGADIGTTAFNALDESVQAAVNAGVVVVVAAGNDAIDASTVTPAHVPEAITVGALKSNTFESYSNYGPVLDLSAHGNAVKSLSTDYTKSVEMSGTSMAAPLVAGAAALILSTNPSATPDQVLEALLSNADSGALSLPPNTADKILSAKNF